MKKIILLILTLLGLTINAYAWQSGSDLIVTGSSNIDTLNHIAYSHDESVSTYTSFDSDLEGWLKIELSEQQIVSGVKIRANMPEGVKGSIWYEQDNQWRNFPTGYFKGINGESIIDVSSSGAIASKIQIRFYGSSLRDLNIFDVQVKGSEIDGYYYMKKLNTLSGSGNISYVESEYNAVDGFTGTTVAVKDSMLWDSLSSSEQQILTDRYDWNKTTVYAGSAYSIYKLENPSRVDKIKVYVGDGASGVLYVRMYILNGWGRHVASSLYLDNLSEGWYDLPVYYTPDLTSEIIDNIKLDFRSTQSTYGGIGEVELWSRSDYKGITGNDLLTANYDAETDDSYFFRVEDLHETDRYRIDLVTEGDSVSSSDLLSINGTSLSHKGVLSDNGFNSYVYEVPANLLYQFENTIQLQLADVNDFVSLHVREIESAGAIDMKGYHTANDGGTLKIPVSQDSGEITFDGQYDLEQVKVYFNGSKPYSVYTVAEMDSLEQISNKDAGYPLRDVPVSSVYNRNNLYAIEETDSYAIYFVDGLADTIGFTGGSDITEIEVLGSRTSNGMPYAYLISPEFDHDYLKSELYDNTVLGFFDAGDINSSNTMITVNGQFATVTGSLFTVPVYDLNLVPYERQTVTAAIRDSEGRSSEHDVVVDYQSDDYIFTMNLDLNVYYTRHPAFTLSGESHDNNNLFINGQPVLVAGGTYTYDFPLVEGLNTINYVLQSGATGQVLRRYTRRVYRYVDDISIEVLSHEDGEIVNDESVYISGRAWGAGLRYVKVNGVNCTITGNTFVTNSAISLTAETNPLSIVATDVTGTSITQTMSLIRDLDSPVISNVTPEDGFWSNDKYVTIIGDISDIGSASVYANGQLCQISSGSFFTDLFLDEGTNSISITAQDNAGNITSHPDFTINVDTTAPYFTLLSVNPEGRGNNRRPEISFSYADDGIGVADSMTAEVSINGLSYISQTSPVKMPLLKEGLNTAYIKVRDLFNNEYVQSVDMIIDTTPPTLPTRFRGVPGSDNIEILWTNEGDDATDYVLTLSNGSTVSLRKEDGNQISDEIYEYSYLVDSLYPGSLHDFTLVSYDDLGNATEPLSIEVQVAYTEVEVEEEQTTIVEYENVMVAVPSAALSDEIESITITEFSESDLNALEETFVNDLVSPVYDFRGVTDDGEILDNTQFDISFNAAITYDDTDLDADTEENLAAYYYDTFWGVWFKVENSEVDSVNNQIVFTTNHFTEYSVQATASEDLDPEELVEVEYSNFSGKVSHDPFNISTSSGNVTTSMTDLVLPGKNGFDLTIRRLYSNTMSREDSRRNVDVMKRKLSRGEKPSQERLSYQGAYSFGQGWVLDFPYLKISNSRIYITLPGGQSYELTSMDSEGLDGNFVKFENHDGNDFTYIIEYNKMSETSTVKDGRKIIGSVLHMKNGTSYHLGEDGLLTKIVDSTGGMEISVTYVSSEDRRIDFITDTLGRRIDFEYVTNGVNSVPQISQIKSDDKEIDYTYDYSLNSILSRTEFGVDLDTLEIPVLTKVSDAQNRMYFYGYDGVTIRNNDLRQVEEDYVEALKDIYKDEFTYLEGKYGFGSFTSSNSTNADYTGRGIDLVLNLSDVRAPGLGREEIVYDSIYLNKGCDDYGFDTPLDNNLNLNHKVAAKNHKFYSLITSDLNMGSETIMGVDSNWNLDRTTIYDFTYNRFEISEKRSNWLGQLVNGNKKTRYNYVKESWINDGKTKTTHTFDKDKKRTHKYNIVAADSSFGYTTEKYDKSDYYISLLDTKVIEKLETGDLYETWHYDYDNKDRTIKETRYAGTFLSDTDYVYDNWSNKTQIVYKEIYPEYTLTSTTDNVFKEGPLTNDNGLICYVHDLIERTDVVETHKKTNETEQTITDSYTIYGYNANGQMASRKVKLNSTTEAETKYTYYGLGDDAQGGIKTITSPENHVTLFEYTYPAEGAATDYIIKRTEINVAEGDTSALHDIVTRKTYDYHNGNLISAEDGNHNFTSFEYDKLNRKTRELQPAGSDGTRPEIVIGYNDDTLQTTLTRYHGSDANDYTQTVYSFDLKGQLRDIEKIEMNGSKGNITTELAYDVYGNISALKDPRGYIIRYTYDDLNRLKGEYFFDSEEKTLTEPISGASTYKTYEYNDGSHQKTTILEDGTKIRDYHDLSGNLIRREEQKDKNGNYRISTLFYDLQGHLLSETDTEGNVTIYSYDDAGRLSEEVKPTADYYNGSLITTPLKISTTYDKEGNKIDVKQIFTVDNSVQSYQSYEYDGLGRVLKKIIHGDTDNITVEYAYDDNGNLVWSRDGNGLITKKSYTTRNKLENDYDVYPEGQTSGLYTSYTYDLKDRLTSMTDQRGNSGNYPGRNFTLEYIYDEYDRLVKGILPTDTGEEAKEISFVYDKRGNLESRTEPDGGETVYEYDYRNRKESETRKGTHLDVATEYRTEYRYDDRGNRTELETPGGQIWTTNYDVLGRKTAEIKPAGEMFHFRYDDLDRLVSKTGGRGFEAEYEYDVLGRLISETDETGEVTGYDYDVLSNRSRLIDARGNDWIFKHNKLGQLIEEVNSKGDSAYYSYDASGRLETIIDPKETTVTYFYDDMSRITGVTYLSKDGSESQSETFSYDEAGNLKTASNEGVSKTFNYSGVDYVPDTMGLVNSTDLSFGGKTYRTEYNYDKMNRLKKVIHNTGLEVDTFWNNLGQLEEITGYVNSFTYDTNSLTSGFTLANGVAGSYDFDDNQRLTDLDYLDSLSEELIGYDFNYDKDDNLTGKDENSYAYDRRNQLIVAVIKDESAEKTFTVNDPNLGHSEWDLEGQNRTEVVEGLVSVDYGASSLVVDYGYPFRMKKVMIQPTAPAQVRLKKEDLQIFTAMYNLDDHYTLVENENVTITDDINGSFVIEFTEAVFGQYVKIHSHYNELDSEGHPVQAFSQFAVDGADNLEAVAVVSGRNESYNYDEKGNRNNRLIMEGIADITNEAFQADADSDRMDVTFAHEISGENTIRIKYGNIYDRNGNLIERSTLFTGEETGDIAITKPGAGFIALANYRYYSYTYDLKNRLVKVEKYIEASGLVETIAEYLYDIDGYRVSKKVYENNNVTGSTHYVYDMDGKVLDEVHFDGAGTKQKTYSYVYKKRHHLARIEYDAVDVKAETLYYGTDQLGSTVMVTNASGTKIWEASYTPFGDKVSITTERDDIDFKYTGKDFDEALGFYYFNARWYDPQTGKFISEDPIRDGSNWYTYTANNPIRFIDPTGLSHTNEYYEAMGEAIEEQSKVYTETQNSGNDGSGNGNNDGGSKSKDKPDPTFPIGVLSQGVDPTSTMPALGPLEKIIYNTFLGLGALKNGLTNGWDKAYQGPNGEYFFPGEAKTIAFTTTMDLLMLGAFQAGVSSTFTGVNPAKLARNWQGKGDYPGVDDWVNIKLTKGTKVYGGAPGQSGFYTSENAINSTGADAIKIFQGLQVGKGTYPQYRPGMTVYEVNKDLTVGYSKALANPQHGSGGLSQYYINDTDSLTPLHSLILGNR